MYVSYGSGFGNYLSGSFGDDVADSGGLLTDPWSLVSGVTNPGTSTTIDTSSSWTNATPAPAPSSGTSIADVANSFFSAIGKGLGSRIAGPSTPAVAASTTPSWLPLALLGGGIGLVGLMIVARK